MNREARKYGRIAKSFIRRKINQEKTNHAGTLEEVLSQKDMPVLIQKSMKNRACSVYPENEDFGQFTDDMEDQYQNLLMEQYGFDPLIPETLTHLKELRKALCCLSTPTAENSSQYVNPEVVETTGNVATSSEPSTLRNDVEEMDQYINDTKIAQDSPVLDVQKLCGTAKTIGISHEPLVKVIAEKYFKYKNNNLELRKLVEKIVCVEYDVYDRDLATPVQIMRAYFSLKPCCSEKDEERSAEWNPLTEIPSIIKRQFILSDDDLKKHNEKEIEIIDGQIAENQPYLNDLERVLHWKQAIYKSKNKKTLDLRSLYEMAKRSSPPLDVDYSNTNLLSKAELMEVKEMIIHRCTSPRGIHRETIRKEPGNEIENAIPYTTLMNVLLNK